MSRDPGIQRLGFSLACAVVNCSDLARLTLYPSPLCFPRKVLLLREGVTDRDCTVVTWLHDCVSTGSGQNIKDDFHGGLEVASAAGTVSRMAGTVRQHLQQWECCLQVQGHGLNLFKRVNSTISLNSSGLIFIGFPRIRDVELLT